MNFFKHLRTVNRHRKEVKKLCFKCGLYWQGITHDLSKYSITEMKEGVKYFDGTQSPNAKCRKINGYSDAWLHHKGRNKHHQEYWFENDKYLIMPYKYFVESVCDRVAACKAYLGKDYKNDSALEYWKHQKNNGYIVNDSISKMYDIVFKDLKNNGEDFVFNKEYFNNIYRTKE